MKSKQKVLADFFLKELKDKGKYSIFPGWHLADAYTSLFTILPKSQLNAILETAYRNRKTKTWFTEIHKSLRQCDVFTMCYRLDEGALLPEDKQNELFQLNKELDEVHKIMDSYELELRKKIIIPAEDHPDYLQKTAEYQVAYRQRYKQLFPQEKHSRRFALKSELKSLQEMRIGGHLDMILWNLIHLDKKEMLYHAFKDTFEEFLEEKRVKRLRKKSVVK